MDDCILCGAQTTASDGICASCRRCAEREREEAAVEDLTMDLRNREDGWPYDDEEDEQ